MVVCANAGMDQDCNRENHELTSRFDSSSKTFRRCEVRRGDACDACEVLSKPFFSRWPIWRMSSFLLSVVHEQDFVSSESNEGNDSPTSNDRSFGSNDADIDPHPATLPPTNAVGHIDLQNGEFVREMLTSALHKRL